MFEANASKDGSSAMLRRSASLAEKTGGRYAAGLLLQLPAPGSGSTANSRELR